MVAMNENPYQPPQATGKYVAEKRDETFGDWVEDRIALVVTGVLVFAIAVSVMFVLGLVFLQIR